MKLNLANNCAPKFKQQTIYWITNREGAVLFKDGKFHTESIRQQNEAGDLQELQTQPVRMRHQPEAWTTTDVKAAKERLIRLKLNMGGVESCRMLVEIQPKGGGKASRSRHESEVYLAFSFPTHWFDQRMMPFPVSVTETGFTAKVFQHNQRMQRQQVHKHAN